MVDTNCDPDSTDFPIPANDDAVRSIHLFTSRIADSVQEGQDMYQSRMDDEAQDEAIQEKIARDAGIITDDEKKPEKSEPRRVKAQTRRPAAPRDNRGPRRPSK